MIQPVYVSYSVLTLKRLIYYVIISVFIMSHSSDLRVRVLGYIEAGGLIKTACDTFQVSRSSIQRWRSLKEKTGDLQPAQRERTAYKVDDIKLRAFIADHPDAYLHEIAEKFGVTAPGIWSALKRLKITRKKSPRFIKNEMPSKERPS